MNGWQRIAVVALFSWWGWCGLVAYNSIAELQRIGAYAEYDDESALLAALDTSGQWGESYSRDGRNYLIAKSSIKRAAIGAVAIPLIAYVLFLIGRWVVSGFRPKESSS